MGHIERRTPPEVCAELPHAPSVRLDLEEDVLVLEDLGPNEEAPESLLRDAVLLHKAGDSVGEGLAFPASHDTQAAPERVNGEPQSSP